ncbi:MAG: VWA domain-containing protein [Gemmataceae bacterium]|nr:VWA domain-containing protein [Gemmataceae bacterium]MCI0741998.1 VWA domain-containing protein [Gemmataceae bacterium]
MQFEFSRWDGSQQFRPLSADLAFDKLSEYLLEHGDYILRQFQRMDNDDPDLLKLLIKEGYLEKDQKGRLAIAPRGVRRIQDKALDELFTITRKDALGKHPTDFKGAGQVRHEDSKPYEFGDPVANLNLHETLKNALIREGSKRARNDESGQLHIAEEDFVVYETEHQTSCATVLLLDMSGSMARYGKFYHAKKVALALAGLVRGRYAEDSLKIIGFYTYASPLTERGLMHAGPKPVSIYDSRVFLRVPLDNPPDFVPEHFTNIQAGLRFARNHLARQSAANKQIICVTDGEPTAHLEGRELVLMYPPSDRTAKATLEEVEACQRGGVQLSTFALIEDYFYLGLMNFVDQMARTGRGVAVYCTAGELGGYVLDSFVRGRRMRKSIG